MDPPSAEAVFHGTDKRFRERFVNGGVAVGLLLEGVREAGVIWGEPVPSVPGVAVFEKIRFRTEKELLVP